jgi:hypothetical protein
VATLDLQGRSLIEEPILEARMHSNFSRLSGPFLAIATIFGSSLLGVTLGGCGGGDVGQGLTAPTATAATGEGEAEASGPVGDTKAAMRRGGGLGSTVTQPVKKKK